MVSGLHKDTQTDDKCNEAINKWFCSLLYTRKSVNSCVYRESRLLFTCHGSEQSLKEIRNHREEDRRILMKHVFSDGLAKVCFGVAAVDLHSSCLSQPPFHHHPWPQLVASSSLPLPTVTPSLYDVNDSCWVREIPDI